MLNKNKAELLKRKLGDYRKIGIEYLYLCFNKKCIPHSEQLNKLSINFNKGYYKCWRCGIAGSIHKLVRKFSSDSQFIEEWESYDKTYVSRDITKLFEKEIVIEDEIVITELPCEFRSLIADNSIHVSRALGYLRNRGLTKKNFEHWKPGVCLKGEFSDMVVFPSFNLDGKINFYIGRSYSKGILYKKADISYRSIIFNELYIDWERPIRLVEGIFDAIKAGYNSVPILSNTMNSSHRLFREIVRNDSIVYLALDPDADKLSLELAKKLISYGIMVYMVDARPYKDIGCTPTTEIEGIFSCAKLVNEHYFDRKLEMLMIAPERKLCSELDKLIDQND